MKNGIMANPSPEVAAIVLAAGSGGRFGGAKQFAMLAGERLVDRAVLLVTPVVGPPVLALPPAVEWDGPPVAAVVAGGATRTESVRNALAVIAGSAEIIVVHDIARPLATVAQIQRVITAVRNGATAAVSTWPLPDTLKALRSDGTLEHRGREGLVVTQTPMAFDAAALRHAFDTFAEIPIEESIAIEQLGGRVVAVPGDRWSHHVVEPRDLELFERLLAPGPLDGI